MRINKDASPVSFSDSNSEQDPNVNVELTNIDNPTEDSSVSTEVLETQKPKEDLLEEYKKEALELFKLRKSQKDVVQILKKKNNQNDSTELSATEIADVIKSAKCSFLKSMSKEIRDHTDYISVCVKRIVKDKIDGKVKVQLPSQDPWFLADEMVDYFCARAISDNLYNPKDGLNKLGFQHALEILKHEVLEPELLMTIPEWDRIPRIEPMCLPLKGEKFNEREIYELSLEWLGTSVLKIDNPHERQTFLIFSSKKQGLGKDVFIEALCGGFGHYFYTISLSRDMNQNDRMLSQIIIGNIPEFDKLDFVSASEMKDVISKPWLSYNEKYKVGHQRRPNRSSLIGSTNNSTKILRESGDNRRFSIIELTDILIKRDDCGLPLRQHNYYGDLFDPDMEYNRAQILAEAAYYARQGLHFASPATKQKMKEVIAELSPPDFEEEAAELWLCTFAEYFAEDVYPKLEKAEAAWVLENGWISYQKCLPILNRVSKQAPMIQRTLQKVLKNKLLGVNKTYYNGKKARGYKFNVNLMNKNYVDMIIRQHKLNTP